MIPYLTRTQNKSVQEKCFRICSLFCNWLSFFFLSPAPKEPQAMNACMHRGVRGPLSVGAVRLLDQFVVERPHHHHRRRRHDNHTPPSPRQRKHKQHPKTPQTKLEQNVRMSTITKDRQRRELETHSYHLTSHLEAQASICFQLNCLNLLGTL